MRNFNSGGRPRGGGDFSRRSFNDRDPRRSQLFDAVCAECGRDCKVPFRPSNDKPVYCSDCFEKRGGGRDNDRQERPSFRRNDFSSRQPSTDSQLSGKVETLNKKLDIIISLLSSTKEQKSAPVEVKVNKVKKTKKAKVSKIKTKAKVKTKRSE